MYIKELHISAFGPIIDSRLTFERGLNIIEGKNETGKTSVAMFIKFIFYGLSSRTTDSVSERKLYVNRERGVASGFAVIAVRERGIEREIRIERTVAERTDAEGHTKYSERLKVFDNATGMPVSVKGQPGEHFFGVPEHVFASSAFAAQGGGIRPDNAALREAVENMILAADENVSVKRAVDSIDKERVRLMHKKGGGGEISVLEERLAEAERVLVAAHEDSEKLIKSELSLADVKEKLETAKVRCAQLEELSDALDVLSREDARVRISDKEARVAKLRCELEDDSLAGGEDSFRQTLAVAVRDIDRRDKLSSEYEKKLAAVREHFPDGELIDPDEDACYAEKMLHRSSKVRLPAVLLTVIGVAMFVASFIVGSGSRAFLPTFCSAALAAMVGVSLLILSSAWKREAHAVFEDWGVESAQELADDSSGLGELYRSLERDKSALTAAEIAAEEACDTLDELIVRARLEKISGESAKESARRLVVYSSECSKKKKMLEEELARLDGQLSADRAIASSGTENETDGQLAQAVSNAREMSEDDRREALRELRFVRTKIENLRERELELERECSAMRAVSAAPSELYEKRIDIKDELREKRAKLDSYLLAIEALKTASENIRLSVLPRLTSAASDIMSGVTSGRYDDLGISSSFDMNFRLDGNETLELDYLSSGTREAAYLALRLALEKALYDEEHCPPMILDESLCSLDEERVKSALSVLEDCGRQVFLFTCRRLEATLARANITVMTTRENDAL